MFVADHLEVTGCGHKDVHIRHHVIQADHPVALHGGLQGADRIDLRHHHRGPQTAERLGRPLAHIAIAQHQGHLASHHHIGGALDAIHQGFAATVEVVELALGDRVVDVDGREGQLAALLQLIETGHTRGGFLGDALDSRVDAGIEAGLGGQLLAN